MSTKICSKCGEELSVSSFHKDKTKPGGYFSSCKECRKKVTSDYYLRAGEKIRADVSRRRRFQAFCRRVEREEYEAEHAEEIELAKQRKIEEQQEAKRVRERARYNADPEAAKERCRRYRRENPRKQQARGQVSYAISIGTLVKQPCEVCGSEERIEAHHDDYLKPLDVRWLCSIHHGEEHRGS